MSIIMLAVNVQRSLRKCVKTDKWTQLNTSYNNTILHSTHNSFEINTRIQFHNFVSMNTFLSNVLLFAGISLSSCVLWSSVGIVRV